MRRVVVHEILIGGGLALLLVAGLTTLTARRELRRYSADAAVLRSRLDSLTAHAEGPRDLPALRETARQLDEAEFSVRATRVLLTRLWQPDGVALLAAAAGTVTLGTGAMAWRRRRGSRGRSGRDGS